MAASDRQAGRSVAVLGVGNMGAALVRGWAAKTGSPDEPLVVYDKDQHRSAELESAFSGRVTAAESLTDLVAAASILVVSVKPQDIEKVLGDVRAAAGELASRLAVVSTAAGVTLERLRAALGPAGGLYRVMPNLPVALGEGVIGLAAEPGADPSALTRIESLFARLGKVALLPEPLFDVVTAVGGGGPAFLAVFLEGLEDGAVSAGMPRAVARDFVLQMAVGAAALMRDQDLSPAQLKDRVSSPGGVTLAGLMELEGGAVRAAAMKAVRAATEHGRRL